VIVIPEIVTGAANSIVTTHAVASPVIVVDDAPAPAMLSAEFAASLIVS
jgi:hypothetical protein